MEVPTIGSVMVRRYEILKEIGRGGCAAVFEAFDHRTQRRVALKVPIRSSDDTVKVSRFTRESRVIASIHHPNVCAVVDSGVTGDGMPFLVMERLFGESLRARLHRKGRLGLDETVGIGLQLLSALDAVHGSGVVHRDVKPDNVVLVRREGCEPLVKLLDFGLCRRAQRAGEEEETMTCAGALVGTPEYMAPEQVLGSAVDVRVDLYAVGVVLYEALTGDRAFFSHKLRDILSGVMEKRIAPVRRGRPDAPLSLELVVSRAMDRNPTRRYASAAQMMRDLLLVREELAGRHAPAPAPAVPPSTERRVRRPAVQETRWELPTIRRLGDTPPGRAAMTRRPNERPAPPPLPRRATGTYG